MVTLMFNTFSVHLVRFFCLVFVLSNILVLHFFCCGKKYIYKEFISLFIVVVAVVVVVDDDGAKLNFVVCFFFYFSSFDWFHLHILKLCLSVCVCVVCLNKKKIYFSFIQPKNINSTSNHFEYLIIIIIKKCK